MDVSLSESHIEKIEIVARARAADRLQPLGWIIIQVTYEDLVRHPDRVAGHIREALYARSDRSREAGD